MRRNVIRITNYMYTWAKPYLLITWYTWRYSLGQNNTVLYQTINWRHQPCPPSSTIKGIFKHTNMLSGRFYPLDLSRNQVAEILLMLPIYWYNIKPDPPRGTLKQTSIIYSMPKVHWTEVSGFPASITANLDHSFTSQFCPPRSHHSLMLLIILNINHNLSHSSQYYKSIPSN